MDVRLRRGLARLDAELRRPFGSNRADGAQAGAGERRRGGEQGVPESREIRLAPLDMDENAPHFVAHPAGQTQIHGKPPDMGPEADPLDAPLDLDPQGALDVIRGWQRFCPPRGAPRPTTRCGTRPPARPCRGRPACAGCTPAHRAGMHRDRSCRARRARSRSRAACRLYGRACTPADHQMRHAPSCETMQGPTGVRGAHARP